MRRRTGLAIAEACMTVLLLVVGLMFVVGFAEVLRTVMEAIIPGVLELNWVSYRTYYVMGVGILLALWSVSTVMLWRMILKKPVVHDWRYMQDMLRSQNKRIAVVSVFGAVLTMLGQGSAEEERKEIERFLRGNFEPIRKFLVADNIDQDVLVVSAPWGDGKTSNVLMAVDSLERDVQENRRYIYASAFKYTNGVREFTRDIIKNLEEVLLEWGIEDRKGFAALINNLEPDMPKTMVAMIKTMVNPKEVLITEELIYDINNCYMRTFKQEERINWPQLVVIIDDLDRMLGDDIVQILSLLSVLRRFQFVKVIIPMDTKAVIKQLEKLQIYHPEKYLNKYLPGQCAVKLRSQFQMVEEILLRQIRNKANGRGRDIYEYRPAFAAVLMKYLVDILADDEENWEGEVDWNVAAGNKPFYMEWEPPSEASDSARLVLDGVEQGLVNSLNGSKAQGKYVPNPAGLSQMKRLEQVFGNIMHVRGNKSLAAHFTDETYRDAVEGWIFGLMAENWSKLGTTLRDLKDLLSICDLSSLDSSAGAQFCRIFNQLMGDEHLTYVKVGKKQE